jgi:hypothetical protein
VPDLLDRTRHEIAARLKELKPVVDEYKRLESAGSALASAGAGAVRGAAGAVRRRGPGRPPRSTAAAAKPAAKAAAKPTTKRKASRRKGTGGRAGQAHALVKGQPGITIPELATKMGIKQNYLYRVMPALQKEGKVTKRGRGWYPKAG